VHGAGVDGRTFIHQDCKWYRQVETPIWRKSQESLPRFVGYERIKTSPIRVCLDFIRFARHF
jgi:hypothetical protein